MTPNHSNNRDESDTDIRLRSRSPRRIWFFTGLILPLLLAACSPRQDWVLEDVQGHLPDLRFTLTADSGKTVAADEFRGKVLLLYFGYTHCPDLCPLAPTHLHVAMQKLGASADGVRILFVSVDPERDSPAALHQYVHLFDSHIVGLTGPVTEISALAKRYRGHCQSNFHDAQE